MSTIYLVRHAQASFAAFGGANYDRLSDAGHEQSRLLGAHWQALGLLPDAVHAGSLDRHRASAEGILSGLGGSPSSTPTPQVDPALNEFDYISVLDAYAGTGSAGLASDWRALIEDPRAFNRFYAQALQHWATTSGTHAGAESWAAFGERCSRALTRICRENGRGRRVVIVTSAGVVAAMLRSVLGLAPGTAVGLSLTVHNTGVTRLLYSDDRVSMASFNELPHLQSPELASLITLR